MAKKVRLLAIALTLLAVGCTDPPERSEPSPSKPGNIQFAAYCAACHRPDGRGVEGGGPPLAGSEWVGGPESRLIRIMLHGVRGPIGVGDKTYNREMLAFGPILSDGDIASILTFVRSRWGGPAPPVTPESVRRVRTANRDRTEYWTVKELVENP